jgi:hypothetical protein
VNRRTARRRAGAAGALGVLALAVVPACKKTPTLDLDISLPSNVASSVVWLETGVFAGDVCSSIGGQLAGGVPTEGYLERIAFSAGGPPPPILSDLPRAQYAVAVAGRTSDCTVVAAGCANVDLSSAKSVTVTLSRTTPPLEGTCASGDVCQDARCTPATNSGNTGVGAGCSLELLGAGPLADPLLIEGGGVTSAPAIAATSTGFLIAYREYDGIDGLSRVTVLPIEQAGGALPPEQVQQNACSQTQTSDATGVVFSGAGGFVADARAACGGTGGVDLFALDGDGELGNDVFASLGATPVFLSTAHAVAQSTAGTFLAYIQSSTANLSSVNGSALGPPTAFDGAGASTDAWVAASNDVVALVTVGQAPGTATTVDAGAATVDDGGEDAGAPNGQDDAAVPAPTGPSPSQVRVNVVDVSDGGSPFGPLTAPITFPGTWASVSAQEGRVFVASDGQTSSAPIAYAAFDVGHATPSVSAGFSTSDPGPVLYTDVAFHQDHVFFAVETPGAITLVAFENASTTPSLLRSVELGSDPRIPTLADVRDGRVAVLATDSRVLVAWTTQEVLTANDAAGGYALFACTTP